MPRMRHKIAKKTKTIIRSKNRLQKLSILKIGEKSSWLKTEENISGIKTMTDNTSAKGIMRIKLAKYNLKLRPSMARFDSGCDESSIMSRSPYRYSRLDKFIDS